MTKNTQKQVAKPKQRNQTYDVAKHWYGKEKAMKQARTLTQTDLQKVLDYIGNRKHAARNRAMLLMTTMAGLRVGEVASLYLRDIVDADGRVHSEIILRAEQTKGNEARTVFINERLRTELETYISSHNFLNPTKCKLFYTQQRHIAGFTANTLTQYFHYLYKRAGIVGASSHSGRRSFITNLASKGVGVRVLASLAGHKSIATTQRYIEVNADMLRKAAELA